MSRGSGRWLWGFGEKGRKSYGSGLDGAREGLNRGEVPPTAFSAGLGSVPSDHAGNVGRSL